MIYLFEGEQAQFLEEKFTAPISNGVRIGVWKSRSKQLGFNVDKDGIEFLASFLKNSFTIMFPDKVQISDIEGIEWNIHSFRGISFWGQNDALENVLSENRKYEAQVKKNSLLKRYNKPVLPLALPEISRWQEGKQYTLALQLFCEEHALSYVIWDWSDFGVYFFQPDWMPTIRGKLIGMCNEKQVAVVETNMMDKMPFH